MGARSVERHRDQRGGGARQAVLDEGLGSVRQRDARPNRRGPAPERARTVRRARAARAMSTAPLEVEQPEVDEVVGTDRPWIVIVWNDPVNLMSYVVFVFQKLFGYSRDKATRLMLQVHHEGKAAVSEGTREKAESDVARLHAHGLWATMEHPS